MSSVAARSDQRLEDDVKARLASIPRAASDCVHVWQLDCSSVTSCEEGWWGALNASERERASRFNLAQHRREFVAGRATLRTLLGAYLDSSPRDVVLTRGKFGKPRVASPEDTIGI